MQQTKKSNRKNSLADKLSLCFAASILIVTIIICFVFTILFQSYTERVNKEKMEQTANSISSVITNLLKDRGGSFGDVFGGDNGFYGGPFDDIPKIPNAPNGSIYIDGPKLIRTIKEITDAEVWLVDLSKHIFTTSQDFVSSYSNEYFYENLSSEQKYFINKIFEENGYDVYGESFGNIFGEATITMGVPIYTMQDGVVGAVLLHNPKLGVTESFENGLLILLSSLGLAIIIGTLLSIFASRVIVKPIKKINETAIRISEGDYSIKTEIYSNDEIGELAETMDDMGEKLQCAEKESKKLQQMRQDFIANISHELRTPVTVIRGSLEALCEGIVNEPKMVEEYHNQLLSESIYMQRLVNDLLDLSRLQNPDFSINICEFNLCDCINDVVRSARRISEEKKIEIIYKYENPYYIMEGDYDRIRQMLLIITDNAIKFTEGNNNVEITFKENVITISNIGLGIDEKDLPYIFERFYKSRSEQNKNGTGLGLAIAKQIATRHNININVESSMNEKTTFTFVFPSKI